MPWRLDRSTVNCSALAKACAKRWRPAKVNAFSGGVGSRR